MALKVAVCLSGFPRNYEETFDCFKKHVLDTLSPDLFFYGYNQKAGCKDEKFFKLYNFKDFVCRDYTEKVCQEIDEFCGNWNPILLHHCPNFRNLKSQFFNIFKSNELKNNFEKNNSINYDIVIRARFEQFFTRDVTLKEIVEYPKNSIAIPPEWNFKEVGYYGVTDQFAIGNKNLMNIYSDAIKSFKKYNLNDNILCHTETLLGYHLHINKIKIHEVKRHYEWAKDANTPSSRHSKKFAETEIINK